LAWEIGGINTVMMGTATRRTGMKKSANKTHKVSLTLDDETLAILQEIRDRQEVEVTLSAAVRWAVSEQNRLSR
jgi:hypothetical protein